MRGMYLNISLLYLDLGALILEVSYTNLSVAVSPRLYG